MITYEELAERLALDLAFLNVHEFVNLRQGHSYVQVIQGPDDLRAELMIHRPVTGDERRWLVSRSWRSPPLGQPTWVRDAAWPPTAAAARELAGSMVEAARSFLSADIAQIECDARNYDTWAPIELPSLNTLRRAPVRRTASDG